MVPKMNKPPTPLCVLDENCPLRQMFDLVADRWTPVVLYVLSYGVQRYGNLQKHIPGVSKKMLTQTLRALERDGLVTRKVYPVVPPRTEYELTDLGKRVLEPVLALAAWAVENHKDLADIFERRTGTRPDQERTPEAT